MQRKRKFISKQLYCRCRVHFRADKVGYLWHQRILGMVKQCHVSLFNMGTVKVKEVLNRIFFFLTELISVLRQSYYAVFKFTAESTET